MSNILSVNRVLCFSHFSKFQFPSSKKSKDSDSRSLLFSALSSHSSYDTKLFEAAEATAVAREENEELRRQLTDLEEQHRQSIDELHQKDLQVSA